jgi:hypothetical protein
MDRVGSAPRPFASGGLATMSLGDGISVSAGFHAKISPQEFLDYQIKS